jgi:hypothetical protein
MSIAFRWLRQYAATLFALALIAVLYGSVEAPKVMSRSAAQSLRNQFAFQRFRLPVQSELPSKSVRRVHPSLERISAWISAVGAGVALGDIDGDGISNDICHVDPRTDTVLVSQLYQKHYQPFRLEASRELWNPKTMAPMGCLIGDLDEDGRADLVVYFWGRTPLAFMRRGERLETASFEPVELVPTGEKWYTNAAAFADLDGDGHTDLIIGNYFPDESHILDNSANGRPEMHNTKSRAFNGGSKRFLLWRKGTGSMPSFVDAPSNLPNEVLHGWTLALGATDLDGDMRPDIYLANDFGPDRLLHNISTPGSLRFELLEGRRELQMPSSAVLGKDSFKGMGVDFADINGDGIPDIFVSNIADEYALQESHMLWLSTGEPFSPGYTPYRQSSEKLGVSRSGWGWDARFVDFTNAGRFEIIQATGFLKGKINRWPELQALGTANDSLMHDPGFWPRFRPGDEISGHTPTAFFVLGDDDRYHNLPEALGVSEPMVSRGVAVGDIDCDGRMDFILANQWEDSYAFFNRSPKAGAFLGLHLQHAPAGKPFEVRTGNYALGSPAIGAAVVAHVQSVPSYQIRGSNVAWAFTTSGTVDMVHTENGRIFRAQSDGGSGHSGKRSPDVHFGLGPLPAGAVVTVDITWRSRKGEIRRRTIELKPDAWYTVLLDS